MPVPIGPWLALSGRDRRRLGLPIGSGEAPARRAEPSPPYLIGPSRRSDVQ